MRETKAKTQRAAGRGHIPKVSGSGLDVKAALKTLEAGAVGRFYTIRKHTWLHQAAQTGYEGNSWVGSLPEMTQCFLDTEEEKLRR